MSRWALISICCYEHSGLLLKKEEKRAHFQQHINQGKDDSTIPGWPQISSEICEPNWPGLVGGEGRNKVSKCSGGGGLGPATVTQGPKTFTSVLRQFRHPETHLLVKSTSNKHEHWELCHMER